MTKTSVEHAMGVADIAQQSDVTVEPALTGPVPDDVREAYTRAMAVFRSLDDLDSGVKAAATRLLSAVDRLESLLAVDPVAAPAIPAIEDGSASG
jgi:hypothetical protein